MSDNKPKSPLKPNIFGHAPTTKTLRYKVEDANGNKHLIIETISIDMSGKNAGLTKNISARLSNGQAVQDLTQLQSLERNGDEINLLEPGYYLKIQNKTGQVKKIKYFNINFLSNSNTNDDINDLENKIIKSVEMQCFADVNIGSHLSGGIDSSLITAIASKFKKDLKAFHGYFPEDKKSYSEIEYAREVAKHLNIELFVVHQI